MSLNSLSCGRKNVSTQKNRKYDTEWYTKEISLLGRKWPVRFIIIDAVNDLVSWYKSFGFEPIRQMAVENAGFTTRMYYDCYHHDRAELERYEEACINDLI